MKLLCWMCFKVCYKTEGTCGQALHFAKNSCAWWASGGPVALSELAHERKYCTGHEAKEVEG
jgi:hypothetical protein